ncbi:sugar phosphate isomerase/epimerase [Methylocapsa sp. S129]|uniref:sugar phosphate isomerase/epimerase family protein n=1 Tax=Methylocapsa sp. S129 TaxID=1641869 RepID=UPI00131DCC7B|nr:sugar phosphate isomerase/epimerase [Methylocapsa sp. S129]
MQNLLFLQSLWAMERRHTDGAERTLEQNIEMIVDAGYDGVSMSFTDADLAHRASALLKPHGKVIEAQCFPRTVDDLAPALELASAAGVHHLDIQADVRPRRLDDCIPLIEGWRRLAEQVDFPVYFETHRDRMTTDLYFTLDLLDRFPDLKLLGDLSHFLVGREFATPISAENHAYINRILDHCWAFHGRVASREQVQIEIAFAHHRIWLDIFLGWWKYGFESWRRRAGPDDSLAFVCELGPQPYAITGPDGNDTTDRWQEALLLREHVRGLWNSPPAG